MPSIINWISNIETFLEMWELLKKEHQICNIITRQFNQDPLENFFCGIRSNGVRNTNPTCAQFVNAYKTLLVNNLVSPHSVNANCEADDNKCLQSLCHLLNDPQDSAMQEKNSNFHIDSFIDNLSLPITVGDDEHNVLYNESKRYVAGYIINKCQKIFKSCNICRNIFINPERDPATYTYYRDYTKKIINICKQ